MKFVLLFLFATSAYAREQPSFVNEVPNHEQVIDDIYRLMETLKDIKYFDFVSIPFFFPLEEEFFDMLFLLQKIKVEPSAVTKLRETTTKEVRAIQDLFYNHSAGITELVDFLAETAHSLQVKDKDVEKLEKYWRKILRLATGSVSKLMTIIEKVEVHSAQFQYTVEKLIKSAKSTDLETVAKIRQRVFEVSGSYSESYEQLFMYLEAAHEQFDIVMPALQTYIDFLSVEYEVRTVQ